MKERPPGFWELAVQATTNTRQGYNLLAPRFELTDYATPHRLIEACRARVDQLHPLQRQGAVGADLACGTGRAMLALYRSCSRVEGYDFSPRMLEVARQRTLVSGDPDAFFFQESDLAGLQLACQSYDRIVSFGAWGHVLPEWRQQLFLRILDALRPQGVFYTVTADPSGPWSLGWWKAAAFDSAIKLRNWALGDPFHMYYLLNDTVTVKRLFESAGPCQVRLEPLPRWPHPQLTLLTVRRSPASS